MSEDTPGDVGEVRPDVLTRFKTGNHAWRARSSHGRRPIFADPEQLENACDEYLTWVEENPMVSAEVVKFQGTASLTAVPKLRAPTIHGLCNFLDIARSTWRKYRDDPDFSPACERIEDAIYQHKVEAAAAGLMDAGFIGREIGLADKRELSGAVALTPTNGDMSLDEATRVLEANLRELRGDG